MMRPDDMDPHAAAAFRQQLPPVYAPQPSVWPGAKRILGTVVTSIVIPLSFAIAYALLSMHDEQIKIELRLKQLEDTLHVVPPPRAVEGARRGL